MAHKAKFGYNPNRNTVLDQMMREQRKENEKEKENENNVISKYD